MLSFQAHPEIGVEFSRKILLDHDTTYTEGQDQKERDEMVERVGDPQDGLDLLRRVLEWVKE